MSAYAPVTPYATGDEASDAESIVRSIDTWASSPVIDDLVGAFGGATATGSPEARLDALEIFSVAHWDFRGGRERNEAGPVKFEDDVASLVLEAAEALGLRSSTRPRRERYDHVLVLGGLVRACLLRSRYAGELVTSGVISSPEVTALGAYRPLKGDELDMLAQLDLHGVVDEVGAMRAGLVRAFDLHGDPHERRVESDAEFGDSLVQEWTIPTGLARLVVAPSPEPEKRRANTPDTYSWWADEVAQLGPGASILVVTSSIYVPYQNAGAVERLGLPYHVSVETVGLDFTSFEHGVLRQDFGPQQYLQEIHSAIRGAKNLRAAAAESLRGSADDPVTAASGNSVTAPPPPDSHRRCPVCRYGEGRHAASCTKLLTPQP